MEIADHIRARRRMAAAPKCYRLGIMRGSGGLTMSEEQKTLYERLGGYDAIAAVANDLLPRLRNDPQLGRFWKNRAEDSIMRGPYRWARTSE